MDGKFAEQELFTNYYESSAELIFAWGKTDASGFGYKDKDGNTILYNQNQDLDYSYISVKIDTESERIHINGNVFWISKGQSTQLNRALAKGFVNPIRVMSSSPRGFFPPSEM